MTTSLAAAVRETLPECPTHLLFRHGGDGPSDTTLVIVWGPESAPIAVVKVARGARGRVLLAHEAARLTTLADSGTRSVPRLLALRDLGAMSLLVESHLPGQRLKDLAPDDPQRHPAVGKVTDWLIDFTLRNPCSVNDPGAADPVALVASYRRAFAVDAAETRLLDQLLVALPREFPNGVPRVAFHGDLSDANVLVNDGDIAVVDWAEPKTTAPAGADLFHLYLSISLTAHGLGDRHGFERGFDAAFFADTEWSRRFRTGFRRYRAALGLSNAGAELLFALAWLGFARAKLDYVIDCRDAGGREVDAFTQPQTLYPVVFFADRGCLNLRHLAGRSGELCL